MNLYQSINQFLKWPKWHSHCRNHWLDDVSKLHQDMIAGIKNAVDEKLTVNLQRRRQLTICSKSSASDCWQFRLRYHEAVGHFIPKHYRPNIHSFLNFVKKVGKTWLKQLIFRTSNACFPDWVAWSSVCLSIGLTVTVVSPAKNGWTDRDSVWVVGSGGSKEACIRWGCTLAQPGKYDWIVRVRRRYGLMSNDFDHLLILNVKSYMAKCHFCRYSL